MDDKETQHLLNEYQANLTLWQHDDNLRQQWYGTFLNINSLLLVALGGLVALGTEVVNALIVAVLIALFGFPICLMWHQVQSRNGEYIRFRRYQLRSIEARLKPMSTFQNQWRALNKFERITFKDIEDKFEIKRQAKVSSTTIEGRLPLVLASFWVIVFVGSVTIGVLKLMGYIS